MAFWFFYLFQVKTEGLEIMNEMFSKLYVRQRNIKAIPYITVSSRKKVNHYSSISYICWKSFLHFCFVFFSIVLSVIFHPYLQHFVLYDPYYRTPLRWHGSIFIYVEQNKIIASYHTAEHLNLKKIRNVLYIFLFSFLYI